MTDKHSAYTFSLLKLSDDDSLDEMQSLINNEETHQPSASSTHSKSHTELTQLPNSHDPTTSATAPQPSSGPSADCTVLEIPEVEAKHSPYRFSMRNNASLIPDGEAEDNLKCIITTILFLGIVAAIVIVALLYNPEM